MSAVQNTSLWIVRAITAVVAAVVIVVVVLLVTGGKSYDLNLRMADADGVRPGSQVLLGGISVGTVTDVSVDGNSVIVHLGVNPKQVHVGQGAKAAVVAANLLGEEYVQLTPGDGGEPLPSGTTLAESATTVPTALDQLIDVMDAPTRARLADLLQEAGLAVDGRRTEVSDVLRQLPLSLTAAQQLLSTMVHDNTTLSDLISTSNQFIAKVNTQTKPLDTLISTASQAGSVLADNGTGLQTLIVNATHTMRTFTGTFNSARTTFTQIVPTLNYVTRSAPEIDDVLRNVKPFTQSAVPLLNKAATVSPSLTRLSEQATPTIKSAIPDLVDLNTDAQLSKPLSGWLGLSAPDLFNILGGWPDAVQYRNASSHVFSGDFYLDPMIVINAANHGATAEQQCKNLLDIKSNAILQTIGKVAQARQAHQTGCGSNAQQTAPTTSSPKTNPLAGVGTTATKVTTTVQKTLTTAGSGIKTTVGGLASGIGNLAGGVSKTLQGVGKSTSGTVSKVTSGLSQTLGGGKGSSQQTTTTTQTLQSLLGYLTGK